MSKRIEEILDVVQEVREGFQNEPGGPSVKDLRIQALYSVADRRGIQSTSVSNMFRRQLRPEVDGTAGFDRLLESWLVSGSDELANVLLKYTIDPGDEELINNTFYDASEPDAPMAQEPEDDPDDVDFREGNLLLCFSLRRGRSRAVVVLAKKIWNREHNGEVPCRVCSFSFCRTYGKDGKDFIQAHHIQAVSSMEPDTPVTPDDLVPVCSNCHSIIHRQRPWLTVDELRRIVLRQRDLESA